VLYFIYRRKEVSKAEENEALIRRVYDEYNKGNYDVYDECFTDDFVSIRHDGSKMDKASYKQFLTERILRNYPDIQRTIDDLIVSEDRAALYYTWTGTDNAQIQGRPTPSGKKLTIKELYFIRFKDGKISEYRQYGDVYGMMLQMGSLIDRRPLEENKEIVRRFNEGRSTGDLSVIDDLLTDDCIVHALGTGGDSDRESLRKTPFRDAMPDSAATIEDMVAEGDKVAMRFTWAGTHTDQLGNIAPTGKHVEVARFALFRLENSKIAEIWILTNSLGFYQQLGLLPPDEEIGK
jgi:steroid delta-isomerase-like uncharacterized protein